MKILVSGCSETVAKWNALRPDRVAMLRTPSDGNALPESGEWAADNDCFGGLNHEKYLRFLSRIVKHPNKPLFVTCPDKVADAEETERLFMCWHRMLIDCGLPVALVLQDGMERCRWRALLAMAWDRIACVFIGGSTEFKLSDAAAEIAQEAKRRQKWVHVGRVNSRRRIEYFVALGCVDSIDGSGWSAWGEKRIPLGVRWVDRALGRKQTMLFGGTA